MENKKSCLKCNRFGLKQYKRGYCASCYRRLRISGELKIIETPECPELLTTIQEEILIGLLLGDGCIFRYKSTHKAHLIVARKLEDRNYNEFLYNNFIDFCKSGIKEYKIFDKRTKKFTYGCKFLTRRLKVFDFFRDKWYINGVKRVPKDLILTPLIMAIWFCDDGNVKTNNSPHRMSIKLSTHGFYKKDVEFLIKLLEEKLDEHFYIVNDDGNFYITCADSAARAFIKEIDSVFPKSMKRKRYWDNIEARFYENQPERSPVYGGNFNFNKLTERDSIILNNLKIKILLPNLMKIINGGKTTIRARLLKFKKLGVVDYENYNWILSEKGFNIVNNIFIENSFENEYRQIKT